MSKDYLGIDYRTTEKLDQAIRAIDTERNKTHEYDRYGRNDYSRTMTPVCEPATLIAQCAAVAMGIAFAVTFDATYLLTAFVSWWISLYCRVSRMHASWFGHAIVERLRALERAHLETNLQLLHWGNKIASDVQQISWEQAQSR